MNDRIKKVFAFILCAAFFVGFCACTEIGLESSDGGDSTLSTAESEGSTAEESSALSATESTSEDASDASEESADSSAEEIVDTSESESSEPEQEITYVTTGDYSYAIALNDEEKDAINSGADGSFMMLVNKENKLPDDFVPAELVDIRDTRKDRAPEKMVMTAETALHAFLKEAAANGYDDITVTSGYRSIAKQQSLFNMYVNQEMAKGKDRASAEVAASKYSAYPGTSEHHTGLCVDMHNLPAASQSFGAKEEAKWLAANAHRFGFILRFPQGKEDVTTYMWEPWHFRFVGVHYATDIYESGLCLEEYLAENGEAS